MRKIIDWVKKDIFLIIIFFLYRFLLKLFNTTCPFVAIFGVSCPACGMSRAIMSLFRLDFKGYLTFNFMALPTVFAVYVLTHKEELGGGKWVDWYSVIIGICLFSRYIIINFF